MGTRGAEAPSCYQSSTHSPTALSPAVQPLRAFKAVFSTPALRKSAAAARSWHQTQEANAHLVLLEHRSLYFAGESRAMLGGPYKAIAKIWANTPSTRPCSGLLTAPLLTAPLLQHTVLLRVKRLSAPRGAASTAHTGREKAFSSLAPNQNISSRQREKQPHGTAGQAAGAEGPLLHPNPTSRGLTTPSAPQPPQYQGNAHPGERAVLRHCGHHGSAAAAGGQNDPSEGCSSRALLQLTHFSFFFHLPAANTRWSSGNACGCHPSAHGCCGRSSRLCWDREHPAGEGSIPTGAAPARCHSSAEVHPSG